MIDNYGTVHVSFQSTSTCNIQRLKSLNENSLFTVLNSCGRGDLKIIWLIEMNAAQQLYLATYGQVYTIAFLVKKYHLFYISWKYWHTTNLNIDMLALVVVYDMYKECVTKNLAIEVFRIKSGDITKVLDFHEFCGRCVEIGMVYKLEYRSILSISTCKI